MPSVLENLSDKAIAEEYRRFFTFAEKYRDELLRRGFKICHKEHGPLLPVSADDVYFEKEVKQTVIV